MIKKVLSIAAAAAITVTGASAFDIFDDGSFGSGLPYGYNNAAATPSLMATTPIAIANTKQAGDALIFPAYYVGNGWETHLRVINTSSTNAVVAKVVIYAGDDSRELRDFNIYLSAGDVWTGTIKVDEDGQAKLISTDDSSPLPGGGMADANNPMKSDPIDVSAGYVEVIGCAMAVDQTRDVLGSAVAVGAPFTAQDFKDARANQDHAALRTAYNNAAQNARGINPPVIFNKGVITSGALVPNVNLATAITTNTNAGGDNQPDYFFGPVANVLVGDVRITDTVNGKDMVMPAIRLRNVTEDTAANPQALLFVEGEAANIADRALTGADGAAGSTANNNNAAASEYHYVQIVADMAVFNTNNVWMTYGDSTSLVNNQLLLTSPYKRIALFADITPNAGPNATLPASNNNITPAGLAASGVRGGVYSGVQSANNAITNFGYFTALALVFDESENQAQASQFSPATTPTLNFHYEVSATESNPTETDNLSYYLQQAQQNGGFARGYTLMQFIVNGAATPVPTIATQMMATEAAGRVITNWIVPAQN